jgi:long-chain acyl-CoA synthetase
MSVLEQEWIGRAVRATRRPAVACRGTILDRGQLRAKLDALRSVLGCLRGQRVLLLLPDSLAAFLVQMRTFADQGCLIPLSPLSAAPRVREVIDRTRPHVVVTNGPLLRRHGAAISSDARVYTADAAGGITLARPASDCVARPRSPCDVRVIFFTSGSTGQPKGVCLTEDNILAAARMMIEFMELDERRRTLVTVPLYDYYGFIQGPAHLLTGAFHAFGESAAFSTQILAAIQSLEVSDLALVPHTLRQLLACARRNSHRALSSLRHMQSSSDVLDPDLLGATFAVCPQITVHDIYGLTEAGRACSRRLRAGEPVTPWAGTPSRGVRVRIDSSAADPGEIVLAGPNVMCGYLRHVTEDTVHYTSCCEVRTGDAGMLDEDGRLVLLGRIDHMLNIHGAKLHPQEIERVALRVAGIGDARARLARGAHGPEIHLDVVLTTSAALTQLREDLQRGLAPAFVPRAVHVLEQIERTELGAKIARARYVS